MGKNLFYRLFGIGGIPKTLRPALEREGVLLLDEGISGNVTYENFRAPGRWHSWKRTWFSGAVVLTQQRFVAFVYAQPIIDVPLVDPRFKALHVSLADDQALAIAFDPAAFHPDWSGSIACRFKTPLAAQFVTALTRYST